jgi:hypothetical protein
MSLFPGPSFDSSHFQTVSRQVAGRNFVGCFQLDFQLLSVPSLQNIGTTGISFAEITPPINPGPAKEESGSVYNQAEGQPANYLYLDYPSAKGDKLELWNDRQ